MTLADKACLPCQGGVPPLKGDEVQRLLGVLGGGWQTVQDHHLEKVFTFRNFREALDFTNAVGAVAEQEGHHPEVTLTWGKVTLRVWTHKIGGLTESDFILAAKADRVFEERRASPCQ